MAKLVSIPPEMQEEYQELLERMRSGETSGLHELQALAQRLPDCLEVLGNLAWAETAEGNYEEAVRLYRHYLSLRPETLEVQWRLGDRLVNLNRLEEALEAYQAAVKLAPQCEEARMGARYIHYLRQPEKTKRRGFVRAQSLTPFQSANEQLNKREFHAGKLRLESLPPSLYLESTTKCNFYCRTCSKGYAPYHAEDLQSEVLAKVREEVMPANVRMSITGFGEPTLASNFDEILQSALDRGSQVHFVTNASLLNYERLERLARCEVSIDVSVDGATKETFEKIRTGSHYELLREKLAMFKKLKDIHLGQITSQMRFCTVALCSNIHELPNIVRMARHYGAVAVHVSDYHQTGTEFDSESLRFNPEHANRWLAEGQAVAAELGIRMVAPPPYPVEAPLPAKASFMQKLLRARRLLPQRNRFPRRCPSPWSEPYIHTDGHVSPCCVGVHYLGDLKKDSFGRIWNGWKYRLFRLRIQSPLPPCMCRDCNVAWGINGGNIAQCKAREGVLVKAFYWLEWRLAIARVRLASRRKATPPPPANFYMGRPISRHHQPAPQPPTSLPSG